MKPADDPAVLLAAATVVGFAALLTPMAVAAYVAARVHRSRQERRTAR